MERVIEVPDRVAVELAGEHDAVIRALEDRLKLDISLRGNRLVLAGDDPRVERGVAVVDELSRLVDSGRTIAPTMIEAVASAVEQAGRPDALLGDVVWRHRQRSITPTTAGQKACRPGLSSQPAPGALATTTSPARPDCTRWQAMLEPMTPRGSIVRIRRRDSGPCAPLP